MMKRSVGGRSGQKSCRGFMKVGEAAMKRIFQLSLVVLLGLFFFAQNSIAQAAPKQTKVEPVKQVPRTPKTAVTGFWDGTLSVRNPLEKRVVQIIEDYEISEEQLKKEEEARKAEVEKEEKERQAALGRTSADAPDQFKNLVVSYRLGDMQSAEKFADDYISYMMNLMFEVKQISDLIGKALVKRGTVSEDDMVGVGQYLDVGFAEARENNYSPLKPTHEEAMKRIKPDPKGQAEIYYFFTLACEYCRTMAGDVERLWQVTKSDPSLKMVALSISPEGKNFIKSYRDYTGLTIPIMDGRQIAKEFGVGFIPALVVVAPNGNISYLKSGQQDFARMYEFVRTVQGRPAELTPALKNLMLTPIGEIERNRQKNGTFTVANKSIGGKLNPISGKGVVKVGGKGEQGDISRF